MQRGILATSAVSLIFVLSICAVGNAQQPVQQPVLQQAAQEQPVQQEPAQQQAARLQAAQAQLAAALKMRPTRKDKNKSDFTNSNIQGWIWVNQSCSDPNSDVCAQAAIVEVTTECASSATFFKKDSKVWQWVSFSMVVASASFTAVGASTTLSNAKVFSTLGGTTGLGAVTSTVNANVSGDVAGLTTVNSALSSFLKFVQSGGANGAPPANNLIYKSAPIYAAQCAAAANGSSGTSK